MANSDKGNIEVISGSIGDLIFRIETLTSDRDTIKLCVRAAEELDWLQSQLPKKTNECRCCAANAKWFKFCPDCGRLLPEGRKENI
jgi:hypothetical protein